MIWSVLYITFSWFVIGAAAIYFIGRSKEKEQRAQQWRKYYVYLAVVSVTILVNVSGDVLQVYCGLLLALGLNEIIRAGKRPLLNQVFINSIIVYCTIGIGFIRFSQLPSADEKLMVYLLVFVMDGFSQISGQLFGRHKLAAKISPMKSIEGSAGGLTMCVVTGLLLRPHLQLPWNRMVILSVFIAFTALAGDLLASYYKRLNGVKDFGTLLPGHGGVLDRFDSFMMAASLYYYFGRFFI